MERMCGFHSMDDYTDKVLLSPECLLLPTTDHDYSDQSLIFSGDHHHRNISQFRSDDDNLDTFHHQKQCRSAISESSNQIILQPQKLGRRAQPRFSQEEEGGDNGYDDEDTCSKAIKAKIASHPSYPKLLHAYIDCQKVGAPPEVACLLDEIKEESGFCRRDDAVATTCLGADPELDEFMETYCDILVKYKLDLERPFDEATTFLNKIQIQLSNLGKASMGARAPGEIGDVIISDHIRRIVTC